VNTQRLNQYFLSWVPELNDPRLWVQFLFDAIDFVFRLLKTFVFAAPVVCFWLVIALLWTHPEPFGAQAFSNVLEAANSPWFWSFSFTLTVIYCCFYAVSQGTPFATVFGRARHERLQEGRST
jgi:hypothetical protein